jgi:hypothetical protein
MVEALVLGLVALTSAGACAAGARGLGVSVAGLRAALGCLVEGIGFAAGFFVLNLGLGFVVAKTLPLLGGPFVAAYALEDATLLGLSVLQGFGFCWWLDRG